MANITNDQWQVLINILGAVESGGMVYGQRDYSSYAEAYENSSAEDSITIGAFQEFSWLAKGLLQDIKNQYPDVFSKYDNAEISNDLTLNSWSGYSPSRNSAKAKAIIAIISTPEGKKVQDSRFIEQMKEHVAYGEKKGVADVGGLFEVCNIAHQGGYAAVDRVLAKTIKPYTAESIYSALCTDTVANQVGTYKNRQSKVISWLRQYMPTTQAISKIQTTDEINSKTSAEDILNIMRGWIGLSMSDGSHAPIINIYNSHKPLARGYAMRMDDDYCACTVSSAFIKANAVDLIGGTEVGVERFIEDVFKPNAIWIEDDDITPLPGDIICFYWNESRKEVDNRGFGSHIGIVEYVENGIIHTIEGNTSGGIVARKTYEIGQACIRGFARPRYADVSSEPNNPTVALEPSDSVIKKGSVGDDVLKMQKMLLKCEYDLGSYGADGDFGSDTEQALLLYQKQHGLGQTGQYDAETKTQLEKSYATVRKMQMPMEMFTVKDKNSFLREGPSQNKVILKKIPVGKKVQVIDSRINKAEHLWYQVKYKSYTGWIVSTSLRP